MHNILVDCGATMYTINQVESFIYVDSSFNPAEHVVELDDGTRSSNVAKKKGTVSIDLRFANGKIMKKQHLRTLYTCLQTPVHFLYSSCNAQGS